MRHFNYTLTPVGINNARPKDKPYKLTDGGGLYVAVSPSGKKSWRYQYTFDGKRPEVTIGGYPEIGVAEARERHAEYRSMVEKGVDPAQHKQAEKNERKVRVAAHEAADTFEVFSKVWIAERMMSKSETYRKQSLSFLERFVWPDIGSKRLSEIKPADVLRIIEKLRQIPETAERTRVTIQRVFDYAIQKLLVEVNPALPLRGVIERPPVEHHRHLVEKEIGKFWRSLSMQRAHFTTLAAAKLLMYSMCRKSEVLRAKWTEFDLDAAQWDIPGERMKSRKPHRVYLSTQAVELMRLVYAYSGGREYVFHSVQNVNIPLADATLNHLFKRLDFGVEGFSPHGTRGTAATLLREHGFARDVVELLLAHKERNQVTASYQHHELEGDRREALQFLADCLDRLRQAASQTAEDALRLVA
ncbi:integrase arm-type DNA-binding domain-containing protein [Rugamonas sp. A1-17]|nr:integrase arm-type DNA-binding domain-containing protein [Rugamonas sp. A1-17]